MNGTPSEPASPNYWRSLAQLDSEYLAGSEFQDILTREFPTGAEEAPDAVSRRGFLGVIAASVALASLTSCRKPVTHIVPFNKRPEGYHPGTPQLYATALARRGYGIGVLVKSSDGRPTKIDGNAAHPSSLGGSDLQLQAELLQLYDPARSTKARGPMSKGHGVDDGHVQEGEHEAKEVDPWVGDDRVPGFATFWEEKLKTALPKQGDGIHVLLPLTTSPTLHGLVAAMKGGSFPKAQFHFWSPIHDDNAIAGAAMAFGKPLATTHDFKQADVVVSLDSDFLATEGNALGNARGWAETRREPSGAKKVSRLYVVEATYSTTGTAADHRFRVRASELPAMAFALAKALGVGDGSDLGTQLGKFAADAYVRNGKNWVAAIAKDLKAAAGRSIVIAGQRQPAVVHAIVHAINHALGNVGKTVTHRALPEGMQYGAAASLQSLKAALENPSGVDTLVCVGTNPVLDAPADFKFGTLIGNARTRIHVGDYDDETGRHCDWHFPLAHDLESWGDLRAHDGTVTIQQPLVAPLHGGVSALEFLAFLNRELNYEGLPFDRDTTYGNELVKRQWQKASGAADFEGSWWPKVLNEGLVPDSAFAAENVAIDTPAIGQAVGAWSKPAGTEIVLRACPKMEGGRYANNSWMQEIPDPLTKLSWDNAALISMATAQKLGVENCDKLAIAANGVTLEIPAWIVPGMADDSVAIYLGWGRKPTDDCRVAKGTGFDAYPMRSSTSQWLVTGATVTKAGGTHELVCTQEHGTMAGRAIVREASVAENQREPRWAPKMSALDRAAALHDPEHGQEADLSHSLWTERYEEGGKDDPVKKSAYQWGMVIDLSACTGCTACVAACVAENNIPMVGKVQVSRNREMFWIRADRYFSSVADGKPDAERTGADKLAMAEDPQVANMPVPCMQCENAPCESVCPVAATTHSPDGLNDMVYNRCIGTRYCSNNCPYKVRRFNYLNYLGTVPETKKLAFNPDVTVRTRGVMEKCTYCVQRINGSRIKAKLAGLKVGDGKDDVPVTTACAQACPTAAITFGNIQDDASNVTRLKKLGLNYGVLSDLNTKPRTTYLGRVRNPNPELA
ncbi:MAG: TAT-variant-translocated molybdopterin oxidoreductase [Planctomycetota bacterium]